MIGTNRCSTAANRVILSKGKSTMRSIFYLITALLTFIVGVSVSTVWNINQRSIEILPLNVSFQNIEGHSRLQLLNSSLSSEDDRVRTAAEKELIRLGQGSSEQRKRVIQELLQSVEKQDDLRNGRCLVLGAKFSYWSSVTNIIAELKAVEAIDLLIKTIHCGNGYSGSLNEEPSLDALIKMGRMAIPKLSKALKQEPNVYIRIRISHCLSALNYY